MIAFWTYIILFIFGTAAGSFLNVVILRYDPDRLLFSGISGRSHCSSCGRTLRWYELIPIISFLIQQGRCRSCKARLSFQYPVVELLSGLAFALPLYFLTPIGSMEIPYIQVGLWVLMLLILILISVIDFRLYIIPDGLTISIGVLAILNFILLYTKDSFGALKEGLYNSSFSSHVALHGSFLGSKASFLFINGNIWFNFMLGGFLAGIFFAAIYFLSRGRAMGFGDVKLAFVSGLLLGLPDVILSTLLAFMTGAIYGLILMALKLKGMKDHVPFGPFIALGITLVFVFGYDIVDGYFNLFSF